MRKGKSWNGETREKAEREKVEERMIERKDERKAIQTKWLNMS